MAHLNRRTGIHIYFEAQPLVLDKMRRYSRDARPPSLRPEDTATPSAALCARGFARARIIE